MSKMSPIVKDFRIERFRNDAKYLKKFYNFRHLESLNLVARAHKKIDWTNLLEKREPEDYLLELETKAVDYRVFLAEFLNTRESKEAIDRFSTLYPIYRDSTAHAIITNQLDLLSDSYINMLFNVLFFKLRDREELFCALPLFDALIFIDNSILTYLYRLQYRQEYNQEVIIPDSRRGLTTFQRCYFEDELLWYQLLNIETMFALQRPDSEKTFHKPWLAKQITGYINYVIKTLRSNNYSGFLLIDKINSRSISSYTDLGKIPCAIQEIMSYLKQIGAVEKTGDSNSNRSDGFVVKI